MGRLLRAGWGQKLEGSTKFLLLYHAMGKYSFDHYLTLPSPIIIYLFYKLRSQGSYNNYMIPGRVGIIKFLNSRIFAILNWTKYVICRRSSVWLPVEDLKFLLKINQFTCVRIHYFTEDNMIASWHSPSLILHNSFDRTDPSNMQ